MKLLEPGNPQSGWAQEFRCTGKGNGGGGCNAKLLVEQGDIFYTYQSSYDGSRDRFTTFRCNQCGVLTDINYTGPKDNIPNQKEWECHNNHIIRINNDGVL